MELGLILQRRDKYMSSQRTQVWKRKFSNIGKVGFRMLRKYRRCRGIVYRSFVTRRTVHEPAIVEFWGRRTLIHSNRSSFRSYRLAWSMSAWMQLVATRGEHVRNHTDSCLTSYVCTAFAGTIAGCYRNFSIEPRPTFCTWSGSSN